MKILCLLSWKPGSRWLWDYLPDSSDQVEFLYNTPPSDRYPGYGKYLGYYPGYWRLGRRAFAKMKNYDLIVTWEANTAIPLALLRSISGRQIPPLVSLNFVLKGKPVYDMLKAVRFAMRSVDQITCLSAREIEYYTALLDYPVRHCQKLQGPFRDFFSPTSPGTARLKPNSENHSPYIFSAGRSNRDYQTLVTAVKDLPISVIINARTFNIKGISTPENVTFNPFLPFDEYLDLLAGASFVVAPLRPAKHASGETFIVQAMTARKAVIASETYSTAEMIENGSNGILVPASDPAALRSAIQELLQDPQAAQYLGDTARRHYLERWSFPIVARQIDHMLKRVVAEQILAN